MNYRKPLSGAIMIRIWIGLVVLIAGASSTFAAESLPAEITPYIDEQTVVVARIDLARIDPENIFKVVLKMGVEEKVVAVAKQQATAVLAELRKAGVGLVYVTLNMADI